MHQIDHIGTARPWIKTGPLTALVAGGALAATLTAQSQEPFVIDPSATHVTIQVGKAGMFGFAGHDHEIAVPGLKGELV
ncbi:hypothetical protein, partial [Salmonella sp. SAL4433]|uniref:hypothetical protein n=1 Tax=Salmonella sp. SAL4433 TaxID=3159888 RepID=UPI00397B8E6E